MKGFRCTFLSAIAILVLAACSPLNPPNANQFQNNDLMNNLNVSNEGRLLEGEITDPADRNPNFPNLSGDGAQNTNNIGLYRSKLRQAVERSETFKPGAIYIDGKDARVNVTPIKSYTKQQVRNLEQKLQQEVPRYHIIVKVNK